MSSIFRFKQFEILQEQSALKVGTDAMLLGALIKAKEASLGLDLGSGTGVLSLMIAIVRTCIHIRNGHSQ